MQDIHDIHPPVMVDMHPDLIWILGLAVAVLVIAALLFLLVRRYIRSRKPGVIEGVAVSVPPFETTMVALDRLGMKPSADPKAFYFDLSALFKAYIGETFQIHASQMTTRELVRELRCTDMDSTLATRISQFQTLSDPFRYAPVWPDQARMMADLDTVRQLIRAVEKDRTPDAPKAGEKEAAP